MILITGITTNISYAEESEAIEAEEGVKVTEVIDAPSAAALQISPVSARIALEPEQVLSKSFTVKNVGDKAFSFRVYVKPYSTGSGNNDIDFELENDHTKLSKWISFQDDEGNNIEQPSYKLSPGESKEIKYQITVPEDVPGGGQYACIFTETLDEDTEKQGINTISRAGMIIYATIAGETRREVKIKDVNINSALFSGNINIDAEIENLGNIDFQAAIDVNIQSIFGKDLYNGRLISTVLPDSSRTIYSEWTDTPFYGLFRLKYNVNAIGTEVKAERVILLLPPVMIAFTIILISGIIITLVYYLRWRKYRSHSENGSEKI